MSASILVAYATRYGSTREVAEAIADTLRAGGLAVDVEPARNVRTLASYGAVVLGAPLFVFRWHKDALHFLAKHRQSLAALPVAVFAAGPIAPGDEGGWRVAREQLDKELARFPWLAPVAVEVVGGRYDPAKLRFPDNLLATLPASPLHGAPASDLRHWAAIRAWATDLAAQLQPALTQ